MTTSTAPAATGSQIARRPEARVTVPRLTAGAWYGVLAGVLLIQAVVLHMAASRDVAPYVPRGFDQVQYLTESYRAYEQVRDHGLIDGLANTLALPRVQGWLVQLEATMLFLLTGPGRLAALDLNILWFLAYLGVTGEVVRRSLGLPAGLAVLGIISSERTVAQIVGGAFDFRLDFIALCLWGILLAVAAFADLARHRAAGPALVLLGLALILSRLIAALYVLPLFGLLLVLTFLRPAWRSDREARIRQGWLLAALVIWSVVLAALVFANWDNIAGYYIRGHLTSDEKRIRALEVGVGSLVESVSFYPWSAIRQHAGFGMVLLAALTVLGGLAAGRGTRRSELSTAPARGERVDVAWAYAVLVLSLLVPYAILTVNELKSPVVGSVLVPPLALLAVTTFYAFGRQAVAGPAFRDRRPLILGATILVLGLVWQTTNVGRRLYDPTPTAELAAASDLVEFLAEYFDHRGNRRPVWAMDSHLDYAAAGVVQLLYYERRGVWMDLVPGLGHDGVHLTLTPDEVLRQAAASDLLILTRTVDRRPSVYPYDRSIEATKSALFELAEKELTLYRRERLFGREVFAYVRPSRASDRPQDGSTVRW